MKNIVLIVLSVCLAGFVYAHDQYEQEQSDSYRTGYLEGYDHGFRDQQARIGFDYRHGYEYGAPGREHQSYDTGRDCDFRLGYVEGYADGFFLKPSLFRERGYEHGGYPGPGSGLEGVLAFTDVGYRGDSQAFGIGQYRRLEGRWNDSIESIRIQGNVRVILFDDSDFRGERVVIERDAWDLGGFRKKAASMIVEPIPYR